MNTHPEFGTRVRFDLSQGTDDGARYRVTVYAPNGTFEMAAELVLATGEVRLEGSPAHAGHGSRARHRSFREADPLHAPRRPQRSLAAARAALAWIAS
jgi:hypothetical protein